MTTTVLPPGAAAPGQPTTGSPFRTIAIAADLLPDEIVEARSLRKSRRTVISGLVAVVLALAAWYGVVTVQTMTANSSLRSERQEVARLTKRQNSFADVITAQARSKAIQAQLSTLLAEDLPWSAVLSKIQASAPTGTRVTGVYGGLRSATSGGSGAAGNGATGGGATGGKGGAETSGSTGLPNTSGEKIIGSLTVTGTAPDKAAIAEYVDALAATAGLGNPTVGDTNLQDGQQRFTLRLDLTAAVLGGRFTSEGGK